MALRARVAKEAPDHPPISAEESVYLAGAQIYRDNCAVCHGLLQQPKPTAIAQGMFPTPPRLFPGKGVSDDPPGETYWKVANGIRLTGMPGFKFSLSDVQVWQVSLLLANSNQLPASVQHLLTWGGEAGPAPANSMTK
jgi:mono/diheme cytochrome c family protein